MPGMKLGRAGVRAWFCRGSGGGWRGGRCMLGLACRPCITGVLWTVPRPSLRKRWATSWRDAGMKLGRAGVRAWFCRGSGGRWRGGRSCLAWRAVRRHRCTLYRSEAVSLSMVLGSPLRVMPAAAASACVSLLIDVRGPVGRRAFCSRLVTTAASGGGACECSMTGWPRSMWVSKALVKVAIRVPGAKRGMILPRAFRTADLWLIHAANCCSRYSSWTCCGVRY